MLTAPRAQLIEKLITSPEGIVFHATFLIFEEEGKIRARLISATPISKVKNTSPCVLALCGNVSIPSPYSYSSPLKATNYKLQITNSLYFTCSKPRAPSLIK